MQKNWPNSYEQAKAIREEYAAKLGLDPNQTSFGTPRFGAGKGVLNASRNYLEMMKNPDKYTDEERIEIREAVQNACLYNPDPEELTSKEWGEAFEEVGRSPTGTCKIN